jgi:mannose-1-phosphate guanylyltransferase
LNPSDAYVVSEDIQWSDIGAWEALQESNKNVTQGKVASRNKRLARHNYTDKLVATIDLDDMLVVNTNDVLLVCKS